MNKKKKSSAGKHLKCKHCKYPDAVIIEEDRRLMVNCIQCGASYYLKEQHNKVECLTADPLLLPNQVPLPF